ncbi:MAG: hypothetical protein KKG76_11295 [Euryarchaeota archaeon]|nr:hypothetical protein [Euryarchaeota archaeon]
MDLNFCKHYMGDGNPPNNRYCRKCPQSYNACDELWKLVINLANSNDGRAVSLLGTNAVLLPNSNNPDIVHLEVNARWGLTKEDFLHFIAINHAQMGRANQRHDPKRSPSLTRQEPYVQAIVKQLGGMGISEISRVKSVQKGIS